MSEAQRINQETLRLLQGGNQDRYSAYLDPFKDINLSQQPSVETETSPSTFTLYDGDSFTSRVGRSFNESQKTMAESVGLYARKLGLEDLEKWAIKTALNQDTDILQYGAPTRTSSFTEGLEEIEKIYGSDGDVGG